MTGAKQNHLTIPGSEYLVITVRLGSLLSLSVERLSIGGQEIPCL